MESHVNENEWNSLKFQFQNFKNHKCSYVTTIRKKIQEKFETFQLRFVGVAFWNVRSHRVSYVNENENYSFNIKKKKKKKIQKKSEVYGPGPGCNNPNLKEICAFRFRDNATWTGGWRTDEHRTNFDFMSFADIVRQS